MPLYGLASDGVYPARPVTRPAVRSYRPFSPLPDSLPGGLFSVALSLGSPPLDVIQHPDPVKPGLSSTSFRQQPSGYLLRRLVLPVSLCHVNSGAIQRFAQHRQLKPGFFFFLQNLFVLSGLFGQLFIALRILFVKSHIRQALFCCVDLLGQQG